MLTLLFAFGCGSDSHVSSTAPQPGAISGRVVFDDGTPAAGAEVATTRSSAITDEDGLFELTDLPPNAQTPLRVHPSGGTAASKFVAVDEGETTHTTLRVVALQRAQLPDAAVGGIVSAEGGLELTFVAGSLFTESGAPVTGAVDIDYALLNTFDSMAYAPGNLLAVDADGSTTQLVSNGMAEVTLSQGGMPVQLAENALISFPTMGVGETCGEPFGLYGFDAELNAWVAAGEASIEGERFVASVPHFSYWNCDATVTYHGCADAVLTLDGHPLANQEVGVWLSDYSRQIVTSDAAGAIRIQVPEQRTVSVLAVYDADYSVDPADADGLWSLGTVTAEAIGCPDLGTVEANGLDADGDGAETFPWGEDCNDDDASRTDADTCATYGVGVHDGSVYTGGTGGGLLSPTSSSPAPSTPAG